MWVIGTDGGYLDTPVKLDPALGQKLVIQPGERYEVIIDFAGFAGTNLIIRNTGRTPYPKGAPPQGSTLGRIMQFRVALGAVTDTSYNPVSGVPLRSGAQVIQRLVNPAAGTLATGVVANKTRQLTLNEVMGMPMNAIDPVTGLLTAYPGGPLEILVNNTKWSGKRITGVDPISGMYTLQPIPGFKLDGFGYNYVSELPQEGETEVWEVVNLTADAHPIHLHLVQFQLINRQSFNVTTYNGVYGAAFPAGGWDFTMGMACMAGVFCPGYGPPLPYDPALNPLSAGKFGGNPDVTPYLQGAIMPPLPQEAGWKDTVIMLPGQVTRIVARYAPTDLATTTPPGMLYYPFDPSGGGQYTYVWHCHIIDHEDNEMMRPAAVTPMPGAIRTLVKGIAY
jgi:FtsP/CotA-like multicopper oxidase with cupredoxin domain